MKTELFEMVNRNHDLMMAHSGKKERDRGAWALLLTMIMLILLTGYVEGSL